MNRHFSHFYWRLIFLSCTQPILDKTSYQNAWARRVSLPQLLAECFLLHFVVTFVVIFGIYTLHIYVVLSFYTFFIHLFSLLLFSSSNFDIQTSVRVSHINSLIILFSTSFSFPGGRDSQLKSPVWDSRGQQLPGLAGAPGVGRAPVPRRGAPRQLWRDREEAGQDLRQADGTWVQWGSCACRDDLIYINKLHRKYIILNIFLRLLYSHHVFFYLSVSYPEGTLECYLSLFAVISFSRRIPNDTFCSLSLPYRTRTRTRLDTRPPFPKTRKERRILATFERRERFLWDGRRDIC